MPRTLFLVIRWVLNTCPVEANGEFCALQMYKEFLDHQWVIGSHGPLLRPGQTTLDIRQPDPDVHPKGGFLTFLCLCSDPGKAQQCLRLGMVNGVHPLGAKKGWLHGWGTYLGSRTSREKQGWHSRCRKQQEQRHRDWNKPHMPLPGNSSYQKTHSPSKSTRDLRPLGYKA